MNYKAIEDQLRDILVVYDWFCKTGATRNAEGILMVESPFNDPHFKNRIIWDDEISENIPELAKAIEIRIAQEKLKQALDRKV